MNPVTFVAQEGVKLSVGATKSMDCPFCEGGDHHDKGTFSITRDSSHLLLYICHRAKCGARGRLVNARGANSGEVTQQKKFIPNPYKGTVQELSIDELALISDMWCVDLEDVYHAGWGLAGEDGLLPLIMPVISPTGVIRGHVLRVQKEDGTKTVRSFKVCDEPWLAWYVHNSNDIVVVEDQISALRASEFCTSVALLGAEISQDKFEEIVRVAGNKTIWLALDKDAVRKGFELLKRYRLYFPNLNLLFIQKDIKSMTTSQLQSYGGPFRGAI
jgi:hypothetical protein